MLECRFEWARIVGAALTLLHIRLAAIESALRRRRRGKDMRHWFEAMFVSYSLVFKCDARFPGAKSVFTYFHVYIAAHSVSIPSNFANVPKLIALLLRSSWCASLRLAIILRH